MGGKVRSIDGLVAASVAATAPAGGQSVQYRSAAGVEYRAQRDTGAIARAESALAADPRSVERIVQLGVRSEEHTSELQSHSDLVCRLLLEKKKNTYSKN